MMALLTLAHADDALPEEELGLIHETAKKLQYRLLPSDLRTYDLHSIAFAIHRPSLQTALFQDLIRLARADRKWTRQELQVIRFFAQQWNQPLPELKGFDWGSIEIPPPPEFERLSEHKRESIRMRPELVRAADPGLQWNWVFISAGIYLALSCTTSGMFRAVSQDRSAGQAMGAIVGLGVCFLTGLITGVLSPGRTIREPAIGVILPILICTGLLFTVAVGATGPEGVGTGISLILVISVVAAIQFAVAMLGAWIGEKIQSSRT